MNKRKTNKALQLCSPGFEIVERRRTNIFSGQYICERLPQTRNTLKIQYFYKYSGLMSSNPGIRKNLTNYFQLSKILCKLFDHSMNVPSVIAFPLQNLQSKSSHALWFSVIVSSRYPYFWKSRWKRCSSERISPEFGELLFHMTKHLKDYKCLHVTV